MLRIWDGKTCRYYEDDELAYAASLLRADGEPDRDGFMAYVLKDMRDEAVYGHIRYKTKEIDMVAAELILIAEKRCPLMRRMQDEKRIRNRFLDVPGHGPFLFGETLVAYDWPLVFTCRDEYGGLWLFEEVEDDEERMAWVAVEMTETRLSELKADMRSIQSVFREAEAPFLLITHWWAGNRTVCRECGELPYSGIVENDTYLSEV